jgi:hypothetical protein
VYLLPEKSIHNDFPFSHMNFNVDVIFQSVSVVGYIRSSHPCGRVKFCYSSSHHSLGLSGPSQIPIGETNKEVRGMV